jgi:predicted RNA-binding protein YlxR (DUF448 family)
VREVARVAAHQGQTPVFEAAALLSRREPGRGAWLCRDQTCVETAWKRRAFERALKLSASPPPELKEQLLLWCEQPERSRS